MKHATASKRRAVASKAPAKQVALTVVKPTPTNTLAVIAEALKDPNFKPENMRLVLDMHKEMVAEQARLDYIGAMQALKRKLPTITKDGKIEYKDKGQGRAMLRYASFENIHQIISPLLDEFGFDLWFSSEPGAAGMINVVGHLEHKNGYTRQTVFPMPHDASGGKSGAQGWASAFSFGKRIATIALLNVRTMAPVDHDRDGADQDDVKPQRKAKGKPQEKPAPEVDGEVVESEPQRITAAQHTELLVAIENAGVPKARFCEVYQIKAVHHLPPNMLATALKACADYAAKKAGGARGKAGT